jgi:glycosyl transferase family 87
MQALEMRGKAQHSAADPGSAMSESIRWSRLSSRQLRIAAWLVVAAYLFGFAISAAYRSQSDFTIYRNAGLAAAAGRPIYDFRDWSPFQYAPISAVTFIPFGWISPRAAQLLWFAISMVLALPAMIIGSYRLLLGPHFTLRAQMIIVPLILIARFLHPNFDHGQINLVVVAMVVWGLALAYESKPAPAGFLLAASVLIKPMALPVVAYMLFRKRFTIIISMVVFYLALLSLPCLFLGLRPRIDQTIGYFTSLHSRIPLYRLSHDLLSPYNQSAPAIAVRLLSSAKGGIGLMSQASAATLGLAVNITLLAMTLWAVAADRRGNSANDRFVLSAVFCLLPSFELLGWLGYYVALEIPYSALVAELSDAESSRARTKTIYAVLASTFALNLGTRFVAAGLYYGVPYFCSLALLSTLPGSKKLARSMTVARKVDVAWAS